MGPAHRPSAPHLRLKCPDRWKPGRQWYSATLAKTVVPLTKKTRPFSTSSGWLQSTPEIKSNWFLLISLLKINYATRILHSQSGWLPSHSPERRHLREAGPTSRRPSWQLQTAWPPTVDEATVTKTPESSAAAGAAQVISTEWRIEYVGVPRPFV